MTHPNNSLTFFAYHFSATGEGRSLPKTGQPSGANSTAGRRGDCARTQTTAGGRGRGLLGSRGSPDHVRSAAGPLVSAQSCPLVTASGYTACTQAESTRHYWVSPVPSPIGKSQICLAQVFSSDTLEETLRGKRARSLSGKIPPPPSKRQHQFPTAELVSGFRAAKSVRSYLLRLELEGLGLALGLVSFPFVPPFVNTPRGSMLEIRLVHK